MIPLLTTKISSLDEINFPFTHKQIIFRGVGDSNYKLIPGLYREENQLLIRTKSIEIVKRYGVSGIDPRLLTSDVCEKILVKYFFDQSNQQGLELPKEDNVWVKQKLGTTLSYYKVAKIDYEDESCLELLALAQHYGIKTHLLDFTNDFYVALYFAVSDAFRLLKNNEKIDGCFSIWLLNITGCDQFIPQLKITTPYYHSNSNIVAQRGTFVSISHPDRNHRSIEEMVTEIYNKSSNKNDDQVPLLHRIDVPYLLLGDAVDLLGHYNINHNTIFPGFSEIDKGLDELLFWDEMLNKFKLKKTK